MGFYFDTDGGDTHPRRPIQSFRCLDRDIIDAFHSLTQLKSVAPCQCQARAHRTRLPSNSTTPFGGSGAIRCFVAPFSMQACFDTGTSGHVRLELVSAFVSISFWIRARYEIDVDVRDSSVPASCCSFSFSEVFSFVELN